MERAEVESRDETVISQSAVRSAKAAFLLSSLKSFQIRYLSATVNQQAKDKDELTKAMGNLKLELTRERLKNQRIKLCGLMEFALQLMLVITLSSFFFFVAFKS